MAIEDAKHTKHIVVVDDNRRFFLHVWRYLSGIPGFGVGDVSPRPGQISRAELAQLDVKTGSYRVLADGSCVVWWVDTKKETGGSYDPLATLKKICSKIKTDMKGELALVLIDRHCESGEIGPRDFISCVESKATSFLCVSAYGTEELGGEGDWVPVYPKTDELLQGLRNLVRLQPPASPEYVDDEIAHVLITGAGFELGAHGFGLGLPSTWDLLKAMFENFPAELKAKLRMPVRLAAVLGEGEIARLCERCSGTPERLDERLVLPAILPVDSDWGTPMELLYAAIDGNLDRYFTELLQIIAAMSANKREALQAELAVRQAFRETLLEHDWGLMRHSLDAAELPWTAWISTNYTGFADRAIRDASVRIREHPGHSRWFIVSTAAEAQVAHELQLEHALSRAAEYRMPRYLFKVHGDIGDVRTMALAGEDKEVLSNLKVPVASLYKLYAAAQQILEQILKHRAVVFHIVGHGLQDAILNGLLRQLPRQKEGSTFVLVDPRAHEEKGKLVKHLHDACALEGSTIRPFVLTAAEYMARLKRFWNDVARSASGEDLATAMRDIEECVGDDTRRKHQREAEKVAKELARRRARPSPGT